MEKVGKLFGDNVRDSIINNAARGDGLSVTESWIFSAERFGGKARENAHDFVGHGAAARWHHRHQERGKKAPARSPAPAPRKKNGAAAAANASPAKKLKTSPVVACVNPSNFSGCLKVPKNPNPSTQKTQMTKWRKNCHHYTLLNKIEEKADQTYEGKPTTVKLDRLLDAAGEKKRESWAGQPLLCPNCWQKYVEPLLSSDEDDSMDEDEQLTANASNENSPSDPKPAERAGRVESRPGWPPAPPRLPPTSRRNRPSSHPRRVL